MLTFFTAGVQYTASMFFMSIGKATQGGMLYLIKNILAIAGMALLPLVMGLDGVFWTGPISDLISTLLSVLFLASGLKNLKAKQVEPSLQESSFETALEAAV
jgi:Na+-driven multidrug efflux pump